MIWAVVALSTACVGETILLLAGCRSAAAERRRLLNAIIARTPQEYSMLERITTSKAKPKMKPDTPTPYGL
jgi:hypothetical protein